MDDLHGNEAVWNFDGEALGIRYETKGWFRSPLLKQLGSLTVPVAAVEAVEFEPKAGRKKGWVLSLRLRERTDPYLAVGSQLDPKLQPFRLTGPARTELVAEYLADQVRFAAEQAQGPQDPYLPARLTPDLPLHISTSEGSAVLDSDGLRLLWSGSGASSYKRRKQRREYTFSEITGVETVPVDDWGWTFLRVVTARSAAGAAAQPKNDPNILRANEDDEGPYRIFLMAATIMAHLWARGAASRARTGPDGAPDTDPRDRAGLKDPNWWREAAQNTVEALVGPRSALNRPGRAGGKEKKEKGEREPAGERAHTDGTGHDTDWVYAQIERLGGLRDKGLLSEEEFSAKKAELLRRI
ncbi:DUF4429 domain-containing protein [Nocardiopsis kunsanensis]|uniref:DUF4429 domain-containing protein n=1 Tax=Nocardiopsis kunsanensis TaxID=141693 RepID=A0A918X8S1_9ACTN|nr:DUF4429 domain-containing protein [Nocardiopsis kunsanensis]GHD18735.1 hypothetical protein GCM10007147_09240 [Nocardiopsis kunsanensis]